MRDKPYLPQHYFQLDDQWSSRVIQNHGGQPAKKVSLVPDAITFGSVTAGQLSVVQKATLMNTGYLPLLVRKVRLAGDFVVSHNLPLSGVIEPNESIEFQLQFAPQRVGITTGGLYIDTDAHGENEYVALLGNGLASGVGVAVLSTTSLSFGSVKINTTSAVKPVVVTNSGTEDLTISKIAVTGEFAAALSTPVVLGAGQSATINVTFSPTSVGSKNSTLTITHDGNGGNTVSLSGSGTTGTGLPTLSISNAVIETSTGSASVSASTQSLSFADTTVGNSSDAQSVTLTNSGDGSAKIVDLSFPTSNFKFASGSAATGTVIPAGGSVTVKLVFSPASAGEVTGTLLISTDAAVGNEFSVALAGSAIAAPIVMKRLSTSGTKFVDEDGKEVRLKSVNWFGMEDENYTPHGTWIRPWKAIIDDIASMGFNCIRLAFSGSATTAGRTPPASAINSEANPDLVGLTSLAILDKYVDYCTQKGVYIVLDHHRRTAGSGGTDGSPVSSDYTLAMWKASWAVMANRYGSNPTVVGADLHNEPHQLDWPTWNSYATEVGNSVLAIAPDWIMFVQGVGTSTDGTNNWWGGALKDVATTPVVLNKANRLAYSPHEYGQSVGSQDWLATDSKPVTNYPNNLPAIWDKNWGFIVKNGIAPIWIGEFGGKFGVDGSGAVNQPNGTVEKQWVQTLVSYMNTNKMSFAYWSYNPNSTDTGGLIQDDWVTHQTVKLNLLAPALA